MQKFLARIINIPYTTYILLAFLGAALFVTYLWGKTLFEVSEETPRYRQCEKVYVGKTPFACQPGDSIFVDADVAEKYCTEHVFSENDESVYCIYNGVRDDRERKAPLFRSGGFGDIDR